MKPELFEISSSGLTFSTSINIQPLYTMMEKVYLAREQMKAQNFHFLLFVCFSLNLEKKVVFLVSFVVRGQDYLSLVFPVLIIKRIG